MSDKESLYRFNFNKHLDPIKAMLSWKKKKSPRDKWLEFVELTKESVLKQPEQYLGTDLPSHETIAKLVSEIFEEYLKTDDTA